MKGNILKISHYCTDDGPGIRTTVFLKGCPLSCIWCHNKESQNKESEIMFDKEKCINCALCKNTCDKECHTFENNVHNVIFENCNMCRKCIDICPKNALRSAGQTFETTYIINEILKDKVFYETSNGGVTISGGEPLYQSDFTTEILKKCKENGIHTAIETCGFASKEIFKKVVSNCDLVLFDIKETNDKKHKQFTNVPFNPIYENLKLLDDISIPFIIRLPIIPSLNDTKEHFDKVKEIAKTLKNIKDIEIMPYHILGIYKYEQLGKEYSLKDIKEPDKETVKKWNEYIKTP